RVKAPIDIPRIIERPSFVGPALTATLLCYNAASHRPEATIKPALGVKSRLASVIKSSRGQNRPMSTKDEVSWRFALQYPHQSHSNITSAVSGMCRNPATKP